MHSRIMIPHNISHVQQLLIGRNQKEVEAICEVFEAMKNLEESLNEAADFNVSINETATEIEDITCNKVSSQKLI